MTKISEVDVASLLGPTPISSVTDAEIWSLLLSPQVKALLGPIESIVGPTLLETTTPLFPGDEVSNLNNNLLYGGKTGFVRFPYVATIYKTTHGALVIKRDPTKFKVSGWIGDIEKGKAELFYVVALRDRRYDGTLRANDCAMLGFPYDDPAFNLPLPHGLNSVEISLYAYMPGSRISHASGDVELEAFVANPFSFQDRPELFRKLFDKAWTTQRGPGQIAASIPDVARFVAPNFETVAIAKGYDAIEDAASHYHVAMYAFAMGYRCTYENDAKELAALKAGIEAIKKSGIKLTRPQESWVAVAQSLPTELIPQGLNLGGPKWIQDNISQKNLWFNKPLNQKAKDLLVAPIKRD